MIVAVTHSGVVVTLHQGFSRAVLIYSLLVALWGLFLFVRGRNPSGGFLGAVVINVGVVVIQDLVGLILVLQGQRPHEALHYLYGVVAFLVLPTAYFMSANGTERRDSLVFGLGALLLFGVGVRALMTGAG